MYDAEVVIGEKVEAVIWKHCQSLDPRWCLRITGHNSK